ncbi:glycoside hydrolase family 93 protein [Piloderma croceum F 1598]|uniref:Glycoside hydrolase family 93 protein n=1 Tax=Piloderma croceum (strain F 1598) TaxID=765440 RepID=A0A0C3GHW9_PILCF|nr:glycoside hydrolase family 93 protein [Piloderma croceum F 1598]
MKLFTPLPIVGPTAIPLSPTGGGTYPRLANVQGAILAAYTAFDGDTRVLTISRSTDGGKSFSAWGTVASGTGDLDNPDLIQLSNANIVCTFRNHDINSTGNYTFYRITASLSTDGGKSWTYLSQVDQRAAAGRNGLWEPFNRVSAGNTLQVYYASENSAVDQDILMRSSTDDGATWSDAYTVAGGTTTGRDGMPGCTSFSGTPYKVLCVFETTEGSGTSFTVKSVVSHDDGATWGERSQVYVPTGSGNNSGSPQVTTTSGGAFVTSFMTDEDTSLHEWYIYITVYHLWSLTNRGCIIINYYRPDRGANFKIITSLSSDPAVWGQKTTVSGVQSSWPGLLALTDGTVLGCSDHGGVNCHSISFTSAQSTVW